MVQVRARVTFMAEPEATRAPPGVNEQYWAWSVCPCEIDKMSSEQLVLASTVW